MISVKISASRCVRDLVKSRITSRNYFTDNLGCVIGSEPDRNSESFKVKICSDFLPIFFVMSVKLSKLQNWLDVYSAVLLCKIENLSKSHSHCWIYL